MSDEPYILELDWNRGLFSSGVPIGLRLPDQSVVPCRVGKKRVHVEKGKVHYEVTLHPIPTEDQE